LSRFQLLIIELILAGVSFSLILFAVSSDYVLDLGAIRVLIAAFTAVIAVVTVLQNRKKKSPVNPAEKTET
jgi:hypothetical protein